MGDRTHCVFRSNNPGGLKTGLYLGCRLVLGIIIIVSLMSPFFGQFYYLKKVGNAQTQWDVS